jgi:hypothetical protein
MSMRIDKSRCYNKTCSVDDPAGSDLLFPDKADTVAVYADIEDFRHRATAVNNITFFYQTVDQLHLNQARENENPEVILKVVKNYLTSVDRE